MERDLREQKQLTENLQREKTEENLWQCVVAFQNTPMRTASGLPFSYKLKVGRNGCFTKELWVDRREDSKSLAWSSVKLAFRAVLEMEQDREDMYSRASEGTGRYPWSFLYICIVLPIWTDTGAGEVQDEDGLVFSESEHRRSIECVQQQPIKQKIFTLEERWIMRFLMETRWLSHPEIMFLIYGREVR